METRSTEPASRWALPLLLALAVIPYLNGLGAAFTFDDVFLIRDNPVVQNRSWGGLFTHVLQPGPVWRPLTMLSYGVNQTLSPAPWSFHAVNIALHVAVTFAAFGLARVLLSSTAAALTTAALFAVHPIHTEAVTNVVGRAELMAALAVLASLLAAARSLEAPEVSRRIWYGVSIACFALGPFAKESALTGIGLLIVLHVWLDRNASLQRRLYFIGPFAVAACLYPVLKAAVVGTLSLPSPPGEMDNPLAYTSAAVRIRTALVVLWEYLQVLVVPVQLSADYSYAQIPLISSWWDVRLLLAVSSFVAVGGVIALAVKRAPQLWVAALFFVVPLAVTSNVLFPIGTIKAERFLYLPSFGWCLALGAVTTLAAQSRRRATAAVLAVAIAALGARTWVRNADWQDDFTLFRATSATSWNSAKAHHNLAVAYEKRGKLDEAMVHFRRSLEIYPDYAASAFGIGYVYERKGVDAGAIYWYERAVRMDWGLAKAHLNLGLERHVLGNYDSAEAAFLSGLADEPTNAKLLVNLAAARLAQGDVWDARATIGRTTPEQRKDPEIRGMIALASSSIDEVAIR